MLDAAAKDHWTRNGFLWLQAWLAPDRVRDLARFTEEIAAWPEVPGKWMRYYERRDGDPGAKMLARIENFVPYHEGLARAFSHARLLDLLAELAGEPVLLFKDKINFKLPGGAAFTPHQDAPAYVNFGVEHHLTVMIPVDPFTPDNGCLVMARNACARVVLPQKPDGSLQDGVMERYELERLTAVPGDVIVFDAWVPHASGPNRTAGPRRSYYLTFNPASAGDRRAAYYARKRECFPPEYERRPGVDYAELGKQFNLANPFD